MRGELMGSQKTERFMELEGLRGIAAVMVAIYHNLLAFYMFAFFGASAILSTAPSAHLQQLAYGNPLMAFVSGTFAVALFFVLSGFVLSVGFFQTGKESIIKKLAAKRYLRLMLPALGSVLICYVLIKLGMSHTQPAAEITKSVWLADNWNFAPHIYEAIYNASWGIFTSGSSAYNNVLWTMVIEFAGSFLVFGALLLFGQSKRRWILYLILTVVTFNTWYMGFVLGMLLADLTANGIIQRKVRSLRSIAALIVTGLLLGGYPLGVTEGTMYDFITIDHFVGTINYLIIYTLLGATILVGLVVASTQVARALSNKYISRLGRYTFSLYLVHLPILYSFTTFCFIHLHNHLGYNTAVFLSIAASLPLVALAAYLFERYIDAFSIRFSGYVASIYLEGKEWPVNIQKTFDYIWGRLTGFVNTYGWGREPEMISEEIVE